MMNDNLPKICAVCGDKAYVNNFGALTCQPCKAFFRRNALRNQETFYCYFNEKCIIDSLTRKFCKKCRLKKCIMAGMKKELILNDSRKLLLQQISESAKQQQQRTDRRKPKDEKAVDFNRTSVNNSVELRDKWRDYKFSIQSSVDINGIEDYINENIFDDISKNINKFCTEFKCTDTAISTPIQYYKNNFHDIEVYKLSELLRVMKPFKELQPRIPDIKDSLESLEIHFAEDVRSFTNITKHLSAFTEMCENDRIALIKYGCVEIISIRSIDLYDSENQSWNVKVNKSNSKIPLDILKYANYNLYDYTKQFFDNSSSLLKELDSDTNLIDLMIAILLFSPNRPNIIHRDVINLQQKLYIHLLQRYLRLKYSNVSEVEADLKFFKLMNTLSDVYILSELVQNQIKDKNRGSYEPLLKEIFDLKGQNSILNNNDNISNIE